MGTSCAIFASLIFILQSRVFALSGLVVSSTLNDWLVQLPLFFSSYQSLGLAMDGLKSSINPVLDASLTFSQTFSASAFITLNEVTTLSTVWASAPSGTNGTAGLNN